MASISEQASNDPTNGRRTSNLTEISASSTTTTRKIPPDFLGEIHDWHALQPNVTRTREGRQKETFAVSILPAWSWTDKNNCCEPHDSPPVISTSPHR
jgi:hypothetical protein